MNTIYELLGMENSTSEVARIDDINRLETKFKKLLEKLVIFHKYIYLYFFENDYTCFTSYNKIKKIITKINKPIYEYGVFTKLKNQLTEINDTLLEENDKNCLLIQQILEEKSVRLSDEQSKSLFKFKCFTCANLIDCANAAALEFAAPELAV